MTPSDSLLSKSSFHLPTYRYFLYLLVTSRVSPVPNHTSHTYRFLYTGRSFNAAFPVSSHLPWSSPIRSRLDFSCFPLSETFFTIRQNSLHVTVCMIARPVITGTLPSRLAPCITATHWDWLRGSLAITTMGLEPTSVVQLRWTHNAKKEAPRTSPLMSHLTDVFYCG